MTPSPPARLRGRVVEWDAAKGFGFADDGRRRTFIHIRDFAERHVTPRAGDSITYSMGQDKHGRPCATEILQDNDGGRLRPVHLLLLAGLLATPALALWRVADRPLAAALTVVCVLASVVTYAFYAWDKQRARARAWRISERGLHFWELLGGWPGAFLAQRRLRHKSAKVSYLLVFWAIVVAHNTLALDALLDWRLSREGAALVRSWLAGEGRAGDSPPPRSTVY
jgi:uncharacterized membrane protein YsdA (DUF1294 family)/cold shock CspA family protein